MILTCPDCSARYVVDPNALRPNGRVVRCAKCKSSWKEPAPAQDIPAVAASEAEGPESTDAAPKTSQEKTTPAAPEKATPPDEDDFALQRNRRKKRPRPLPKGSNLPALQNHKHGNMMWGWYSLAGFIVALVSSLLIFQTSISTLWPPSQKLYHMLGMSHNGLASSADGTADQAPKIPLNELFKIGDTLPSKVTSGGVTTLKVEGSIANLTDKTRPLPLLKISLKDTQGQILREWTFKANTATISPDEKVPFTTSLPHPPENATSISVTFAPEK